MYRDRGGVGGVVSKSEIMGGPSSSALDRKRINDALDKHLEKSSPSTSRGLKDKSSAAAVAAAAVPSTSAGKSHQQLDHRDNRSSSTLTTNKIKASDG